MINFKTRQLTEEMTGMGVCKAKAPMEGGAGLDQGARAERLDVHAGVRQTEHSSGKRYRPIL